MKNLGEEWLSLRSVEIHRTFFNNENQKHAFIHLPNIVRIGQLCRLASMMRRRESLDYDQARRLALYLDMQPDTFDVNINAMERLGWVKRNPNMVLEEFIPTLPVVLNTLGRLCRSPERELPVVSKLGDVEFASLNALDLCCRRPCESQALQSELGINKDQLQIVEKLGYAGKYLEVVRYQDEKIYWSPIYYFNRYNEIKKFMQKKPERSLLPLTDTINSKF